MGTFREAKVKFVTWQLGSKGQVGPTNNLTQLSQIATKTVQKLLAAAILRRTELRINSKIVLVFHLAFRFNFRISS